jgi:hypothetical protein
MQMVLCVDFGNTRTAMKTRTLRKRLKRVTYDPLADCSIYSEENGVEAER